MSDTCATKLPWWKVVVFSLTPALVFFVVVEGAARIAWAHLEAEAFAKQFNKIVNFIEVPDVLLGYRLAPNYDSPEAKYNTTIGRFHFQFPVKIHTNSNGYMQREEVAPERRKDSLRIVTVGESTTQGYHVDQSYPSVLRNLIRSATNYPGGVEVINAGVQGYLSDQWTLLTERELAALRPDVVVLYAGWNDFQNTDVYLGEPKKSLFENPLYYWPEPKHWLRSVTLFNAAYQRLTTAPELYRANASGAQTRADLGVQPEAQYIRALYKFYLFNLDRTVAAFRKENKDVVIVISTLVGRWPYESEDAFGSDLGSTWWMKTAKRGDDSKTANQHLGRFNDLIRDYAKRNGLPLIDSASRFESLKREEIMWDFCHFTDVGYRMLGETIFDGLRDQGLLKRMRDPPPVADAK
jgi:lysophospholipase L1-like esterase